MLEAAMRPMVPVAGTGVLEVVRCGDRSRVTRAMAASPLRLLTPRNHGPSAWIYSATYGGGLVDGDHVRLDLTVGPDAMAMLSTQASTKVYRARPHAGSPPASTGSSHELDASVFSGGLLILLPDPVVCFADSTYRQQQRIRLDAGASLVLVDWVSAGRHAAGERWQCRGYSSRLEVHREDRLMMLDSVALESSDLPSRMGRFNILCLMVIVGPHVARHAADALALVSSLPIEHRARVLAGASRLGEEGCIIRLAGMSFEEVAAAVRSYLHFLPALLGDDPWARKW
jgi:urease accessory protein